MQQPERIQPSFVERVWGRRSLAPYYPDQDREVGEVWFHPGDRHPLLIKFIFTDQKLSVQVHPDDEFARRREDCRGKTEMWHIIAAEPGAKIALGFRELFTRQQVLTGVEDGSIESMLEWVPVTAGETYFTPAGVVHAIGAGITLCEIQENSDVTYRLYDYRRGRELHIDKALEVMEFGPHDGRRHEVVDCEHFVTRPFQASSSVRLEIPREELLIVLDGQGRVGGQTYAPGEVWRVPAPYVQIEPQVPSSFLRTCCPG